MTTLDNNQPWDMRRLIAVAANKASGTLAHSSHMDRKQLSFINGRPC